MAFEWQTPERTGAADQAICGGIAPRKATPIKGRGSGLARYAAHTGTTYRIASTTARRQFRFGTAARWSLAGRGRPQRRDQCPLGNGGIRGVAGGRNPGGDEPVRKIGGDRGRASERCRAPRSLEWVTPVLYVLGQGTQLFTLTAPPAGGRPSLPKYQVTPGKRSPTVSQTTEPTGRRKAELRALYVEARVELRLEHFDTAIGLFDDLLTLDPHYSDAEDLRNAAQRSQQLAGTYSSAVAAEDGGDWLAAARSYGEILRVDPGYRDAAARKEECEARQRMADLRDELRYHADAGHWQAVLKVDAELTRLEPSSSDPDGLATSARATMAAEHRAVDLDRLYARARAAEDNGDWIAATRVYGEILEIDPAYRDAAQRHDLCQHRNQVVDLQSELNKQAAAEDWVQVAATIRKLAELDPDASAMPSYTELAARARLELTSRPAEPLRSIGSGWEVYAVSWHPDGLRIAVAYRACRAAVYDISGKEYTKQLAVKGTNWTGSILDVAFSPDGTRLVTASDYGIARVWDGASGQKLFEFRHGMRVTSVAFSPDGARLATGSNNNSGRVWDAVTGKKLLEVDHDNEVTSVAFSPDGTRLATGSTDASGRVWDAVTGKKLLEVRHDKGVTSVAFSPDGTRLATGSTDASGRVWDAVTGKKLLEVRHLNEVTSVAFSRTAPGWPPAARTPAAGSGTR